MAEEVNLGRLVAEIALDNSELKDDAEESIETIKNVQTAAEQAETELNVNVSVSGVSNAILLVMIKRFYWEVKSRMQALKMLSLLRQKNDGYIFCMDCNRYTCRLYRCDSINNRVFKRRF